MDYFNEKGVIAETYENLQSLSLLKEAREQIQTPEASVESSLRAILQSAEVAFLNLADLLNRALQNIKKNEIQKALIKLDWIEEFHEILLHLSLMSQKFIFRMNFLKSRENLKIDQSHSFREFLETQKLFDTHLSAYYKNKSVELKTVLGTLSLEDAEFKILHFSRICNHLMTVWEENFAQSKITKLKTNYHEYVAGKKIKQAVFASRLKGDNFFIQFRSLHQIPEILCFELNNHLEKAISELNKSNYAQSLEYIQNANNFFSVVPAALGPLIKCLSTSDYHAIRENLGLTSGSHSVNLHYNLFKGLYFQLGEELRKIIARLSTSAGQTEKEMLGKILAIRHQDSTAGHLFQIINESLLLREQINQWRGLHLHLPRNNLGGNQTKSLTGSIDAIKAVQSMKDFAEANDPLVGILEIYPSAAQSSKNKVTKKKGSLPLAEYVKSPASLDSQILLATGDLTQNLFPDVQDRTGYFAKKCPFNNQAKKK